MFFLERGLLWAGLLAVGTARAALFVLLFFADLIGSQWSKAAVDRGSAVRFSASNGGGALHRFLRSHRPLASYFSPRLAHPITQILRGGARATPFPLMRVCPFVAHIGRL